MSIAKLLDNICAHMLKHDWDELCGDLHAIRIIGQTGGFPQASKNNLKKNLEFVLQKCKENGIDGKNLKRLKKYVLIYS